MSVVMRYLPSSPLKRFTKASNSHETFLREFRDAIIQNYVTNVVHVTNAKLKTKETILNKTIIGFQLLNYLMVFFNDSSTIASTAQPENMFQPGESGNWSLSG